MMPTMIVERRAKMRMIWKGMAGYSEGLTDDFLERILAVILYVLWLSKRG